MSEATATAVADRMAASIAADVEAGTPFGLAEYECEGMCGPIAEGEPLDAAAWVSDVLDVEYVVSSRGEYLGARVCVALGGPTVWVDTRNAVLIVAWWSAPEYRAIPRAFAEALDDHLADVWDANR